MSALSMAMIKEQFEFEESKLALESLEVRHLPRASACRQAAYTCRPEASGKHGCHSCSGKCGCHSCPVRLTRSGWRKSWEVAQRPPSRGPTGLLPRPPSREGRTHHLKMGPTGVMQR